MKTLQELAELTGSELVGDKDYTIHAVADLESATAEDASFLANARYEQAMQRSQAGVVFVDPRTPLVKGRNYLLTPEPSRAFQQVVELFHRHDQDASGFTGIHPTAILHPTVQVGPHVTIAPYAVIDQGVIIGEGTLIGPHVSIGPFCKIGAGCHLYSHTILRERTELGDRVILQPGVVLGSCGFGYTTDKQGRHVKLNQLGHVQIENDVEIGANTTIDRARFKTTRVGRGSKVDNLVQLGHGVVIGPDNMIIAQTGIAGSTKTGKHVVLAGQTAVAGHLEIGDGVMIAARTGVSKSLPKAGKYGGVPAMPLDAYNRMSVYLRNIETLVKEFKALQKKVENALQKGAINLGG